MNNHEEDRLGALNLLPSINTEKTLVQLGSVLYDSLVRAVRLDEVEIVIDAIGEYSTMVSFYGEETGRMPESLAVDLNEAALLKETELSKGDKTEWHIYASQFKKNLAATANELGVDLTA